MVHEKKRISIEEAANILNLPFKTIEDWGKELEKQGLIKIEYKFTTEILIWVGGEEEIVEKIGDIETQKKFSEEKLGQLMTKIKVANAELELLKQQYTKSINDVGPIVDETNKKIASLSEAISSSEKLYHRNMQRINKLSGNYKKIKTELDGIRKELEQFKKDIQKLPGKTSVQKLLKNFESKLKQQQIVIDKKLKDLDDKINDYKQKLKTIQKINNKIDIVSSELRKDEKMHEEFGNMIDNIEKSYRKFNMISNRISGGMPFDRKMQLYHSKFKEINRDLDNIEKRIEMLRAEVGEESTAADDVYRMYKKLSKINFDNLLKSFKDKEKMLNAELEKIRQLFKEVESSKEILKNVNDTMKEISNAEAMVDKERVKMSDKLSSMSDELKDEIRGLSVYETKMNNLSNRINMLLDKIDKHANEYEKNMKRYKTEKENKVICELCNHRCHISDGRRGICKVRENRGGVLYSLVYGRLIAENVDPIEKKPLFNFLPGSRAFSISTVGCNFRCLHCQNYDISQYPLLHNGEIAGTERTAETVVKEAVRTGSASVCYTYVEPTIFYEFAYDCSICAHEQQLKNVFVSNGYMTPEVTRHLAPVLDGINLSIKSYTADFQKSVLTRT